MSKIHRSLYEEFFSTDSIKRKSELRELIHNVLDTVIREHVGDTLMFWCFPDAKENEMGNLENFVTKRGLKIEYGTEWHTSCYRTVLYSDFITASH